MAQQTAVEWLQEKVKETYSKENRLPLAYILDLINQAKAMEKEQIDKAHYDGYYREDLYDTKKYYNETYKEDKPKRIHIERSPEWP